MLYETSLVSFYGLWVIFLLSILMYQATRSSASWSEIRQLLFRLIFSVLGHYLTLFDQSILVPLQKTIDQLLIMRRQVSHFSLGLLDPSRDTVCIDRVAHVLRSARSPKELARLLLGGSLEARVLGRHQSLLNLWLVLPTSDCCVVLSIDHLVALGRCYRYWVMVCGCVGDSVPDDYIWFIVVPHGYWVLIGDRSNIMILVVKVTDVRFTLIAIDYDFIVLVDLIADIGRQIGSQVIVLARNGHGGAHELLSIQSIVKETFLGAESSRPRRVAPIWHARNLQTFFVMVVLFLLIMSARSVFIIVIVRVTGVLRRFKSRIDHTRRLIIKLLLLAHLELFGGHLTFWSRLVLLSKAEQIDDHKYYGTDDND